MFGHARIRGTYHRGKMRPRQINLRRHPQSPDTSPPFKFYLDDSLVGSIDVLPTKVSLNQIYTYVLYY